MSQIDADPPEPEPEAEIQATADLSPVSPSPVHTAAPQVVPALQDTVDTIDIMVAAAVEQSEAGGVSVDNVASLAAAIADNVDDHDDGDDDDSFNEAYDNNDDAAGLEPQPLAQTEDDNDDYAKMFDSPIEPEDEDDSSAIAQPELNSLAPQTSSSIAQPADAAELVSQADAQAQAAVDNSANPTNIAKSAATAQVDSSQPASSSSESPAQAELENNTTQDASLDIDQLVADLTSKPQEFSSNSDNAGLTSHSDAANDAANGTATSPSSISALPSPSSLPPRPPLPHSASHSLPSQHHPVATSHSSTEGIGFSNPNSVGPATHSRTASQSGSISQDPEYQRMWDQFMTDERQYMSEAKWDRFPEGSRIFIGKILPTMLYSGVHASHTFLTGNLSSDKVSKRDVFDIFHKYGRLAQISLKSAYGFVQYHTIEEGQRAIDSLQDSEVKGRRIRTYSPAKL